MNILHVNCSPRGQAGESRRLSTKIVEHLLKSAAGATLVHRDLGGSPIAHIDGNYAHVQHRLAPAAGEDGTMCTSDVLIRELDAADVVVIGTPMHNVAVPSVLKAWIDHIVRAGRTFSVGPQGKVGLLRDRPVFIGVASGGKFSGPRARQPDFLTPYLKFILGTIGLRNLTFFSVEGTGGGPDAVREAWGRTDLALRAHFR
ncbi:FMN-dependent NADH-azoreductase [Bordetella flabilis]|uniref:FMN dependent NADH:quinone oxidoreductase n=1 Tax=Bordetella flabilis TaxID=463014 RepID=A0A193G949_9BORD|nr:NAD(P)H-dependent oxidoreductase [Bordetella flabilis]ANN75789.1 NAD(P)H dehydrogenase [Bordetella flabilis]